MAENEIQKPPDSSVFADAVPVEEVDPFVADPRWELLDDAKTVRGGGGPDRARAQPSSLATAVVRTAVGQTGVCESGTNGGIPFERYAKPFGATAPAPWCAYFVSWCFQQAAGRRPPWRTPGWVPGIQEWARAARKLRNQPGPGLLFGVAGDHIGLIRGVNPSQRTFLTIEGNTSAGCVKSNNRPWATSRVWFAELP